MSAELLDAIEKLLNMAEKLSVGVPERGALMLLATAACMTHDYATYLEAAERAFAVVHEPVAGKQLR